MRGNVNLLSRDVALILAFVMGVLLMTALVAGGGYLAFTKISIGMLQDVGIINIDLDKHFDSDAEVPVTSLTMAGLVSELYVLLSDTSQFTINTMTEKYGVKFTDKIPDYVTDEYRNMPITELMQESTLKKFASTTLIGDIYEYERVDNPDYDPDTDSGSRYIWYDEGEKIEGFHAVVSSFTVQQLLFGDASDFIDDISIADALSLHLAEGITYYLADGDSRTQIDDFDSPITVWLDSNGAPVSSIINALAEYNVSELTDNLDSLTIGEITSLTLYKENWYGWEYEAENNCVVLETRNDVTLDLADTTLADITSGNLTEETKKIRLSAVLGYTQGEDDKWYNSDGDQITGVMATIAPYTVGEIDTKIGTIYIGELAGYTNVNGEWRTSDDESEATGILAAIADLTVDDVTDEEKLSSAIQNVCVADIMGYHLGSDGEWYDSSDEKVTGFMKVIADSPINGASEALDDALMADILGYTEGVNASGDTVYFDKNGEEVHVLMQKIAKTQFADVGNVTDNLTVEDLIPADNRSSGFISLVGPTTPLDSVSDEVNRVFNETKLHQFVEKGIIQVDDAHRPYYREGTHLGEMTFNELLEYLGELSATSAAS